MDDAVMHAMLLRQASAWESGDFTDATADWHADGVLVAPGNRLPLREIPNAIHRFHADFHNLTITITNAFRSSDGTKIAVEWLWAVTRRSDGARSVTEDAILIDLDKDLIRSWREYFDTAGSVEAHHH